MKNSHSCLTVLVVDIPGQFFAILKLFAALLYKSDASSSFAVALQEKVDQWQRIVNCQQWVLCYQGIASE